MVIHSSSYSSSWFTRLFYGALLANDYLFYANVVRYYVANAILASTSAYSAYVSVTLNLNIFTSSIISANIFSSSSMNFITSSNFSHPLASSILSLNSLSACFLSCIS